MGPGTVGDGPADNLSVSLLFCQPVSRSEVWPVQYKSVLFSDYSSVLSVSYIHVFIRLKIFIEHLSYTRLFAGLQDYSSKTTNVFSALMEVGLYSSRGDGAAGT